MNDLRAQLIEDFKLYGWGDTAAGELADTEIELREKSLLRPEYAQRPLPTPNQEKEKPLGN